MENSYKNLDPIEKEYILAIKRARTDEEAYELYLGLKQYKELYKVEEVEDGK
jgi:hypothetical protein